MVRDSDNSSLDNKGDTNNKEMKTYRIVEEHDDYFNKLYHIQRKSIFGFWFDPDGDTYHRTLDGAKEELAHMNYIPPGDKVVWTNENKI